MTGFLKGVATAMITPFDEKGINFNELEKIIEYQIASGVDAIVVAGTTGEPATMTEEEDGILIDYTVKAVRGRIKVIAGAGSNCTRSAIDYSVRAEKLGADGILAVTPYYNKCTQRGIYEYYKTICNAVKIPVICYNVPPRTGVNILPETMEKIAEIPNVAGIKEASGNMTQVLETARRIRGKCDLYSGEDALNLPILCAGGTAVISVVSNLAPQAVKELTLAIEKSDLKTANELSDKLLPLIKACFVEVNPIPVKEGMNLLGFKAGAPRAPLTQLEDANREVLIKAMKDFGLKVKA
ncbi:MAG: 4-hydroxy-tetrahydrodipicolinate synthase [Clostridia bacterium]|nr:4-hydroxy-tetrahydrodipicolinate synthase [Clostridia bacterium]